MNENERIALLEEAVIWLRRELGGISSRAGYVMCEGCAHPLAWADAVASGKEARPACRAWSAGKPEECSHRPRQEVTEAIRKLRGQGIRQAIDKATTEMEAAMKAARS